MKRYFDLEIGDVNTLGVGSDHCEYPLTFTIEECLEDYCEMRDWELGKLEITHVADCKQWGQFWLVEKLWDDSLEGLRHYVQSARASSISFEDFNAAVRRLDNCFRATYFDET